MSFSGKVKEELAQQTSGSRAAWQAELAALVTFCSFRDIRQDSDIGVYGRPQETASGVTGSVVLLAEQRGTAERFRMLTRRLYGNEAADEVKLLRTGRKKQYAVTSGAGPELQALRADLTVPAEAAGMKPVPWPERPVLRRENCRRAFLRGLFLASGSMSDPERSYHFELICTDAARAEQVQLLLQSLEVDSRLTVRRGQTIVYVKESDRIGRLLGLMDARLALLEYENIRILREMRGNINRQVNCETANISKTANAAAQQIEDIRYIESRIGLSELTNGLDEMAAVRLQYPTATLKELGSYLDPPIGKSGVNHRLRKLSEIAEHLRGN